MDILGVTWQGTKYEIPEDDPLLSKHDTRYDIFDCNWVDTRWQ
jgi:hypothetical protein